MMPKSKFPTERFFGKALILLLAFIALTRCSTEKKQSKYLRYVGDIEGDTLLDDPEFKLCNDEVFLKQYFNFSQGLQYEGEMLKIKEQFELAYVPVEAQESGWVRIRFVVNCRGESGRFRMICSDENYESREFDARITDQLMSITKSLDGWKPLPDSDNPDEYYQYLIFKIENGDIIEILP
ncbi:hypothetical protein O3Q51_09260 [Cryomorphaceae bacterium 1068]|nr:hypothetical protein [Cryomorphaceae bacterium 1068]